MSSPLSVVVLPVPGGPLMSVKPSCVAAALMATTCEGLNLASTRSTKPFPSSSKARSSPGGSSLAADAASTMGGGSGGRFPSSSTAGRSRSPLSSRGRSLKCGEVTLSSACTSRMDETSVLTAHAYMVPDPCRRHRVDETRSWKTRPPCRGLTMPRKPRACPSAFVPPRGGVLPGSARATGRAGTPFCLQSASSTGPMSCTSSTSSYCPQSRSGRPESPTCCHGSGLPPPPPPPP